MLISALVLGWVGCGSISGPPDDADAAHADATPTEAVCGNDRREAAEVCDGYDFGGDACQAHGYYHGQLLCAADCQSVDLEACTGSCGNGICELVNGESSAGCAVDCSLYTSITAGLLHNCALTENGTVRCWGSGNSGQLGDGQAQSASVPVQVAELSDASTISLGYLHSCAVTRDGSAWCWGRGDDGQLGRGGLENRSTPGRVFGLPPVVSIAAGRFHSCAATAEGSAWCWGEGALGALGNGGTDDTGIAQPVLGISTAVEVTAGSRHSCARLADGTVWCWGNGINGQLGNGLMVESNVPVEVIGLQGAVAISAGTSVSCAIRSDGTTWCWGAGGLRGDGQPGNASTPVQALYLHNSVAVTAGYANCCVVQADGSAWCWGSNRWGQLSSDPDEQWIVVPVEMGSFSDVSAFALGDEHRCILSADGSTWCWGSGWHGQLGNGSIAASEEPVLVIGSP